MRRWFRQAPASPESNETRLDLDWDLSWDLRRKAQPRPNVIGILVFGDNHLIVEGPAPDAATAHDLVRHWSVIRIGAETPDHLTQWKIVNRAFRENLEWAVVVPGDAAINPAVLQLLQEIRSRGVEVLYATGSTQAPSGP